MSDRVLTTEEAAYQQLALNDENGDGHGADILFKSHERLRAMMEAAEAERDALKLRVDLLVAECRAWRLSHEAASPAAFADDMERIGHAEDAYDLPSVFKMHRSIGVVTEAARTATDAAGALTEPILEDKP